MSDSKDSGESASRFNKKTVGYQAMLLGGFSTIATLLLVGGNLATTEPIAERKREDLQASLSQVIPADRYDNDLLADPLELTGPDGQPLTVYRGSANHQISALAYEISGQGYAGEIRLIMGVDANGQILGVRVLSHAETPGLGDKIETARDDWILDFDGLSMGNPPAALWKVKKDGGQFDSFSGATITPRAVVGAIESGLVFFGEHRAELLTPTTLEGTSAAGSPLQDPNPSPLPEGEGGTSAVTTAVPSFGDST